MLNAYETMQAVSFNVRRYIETRTILGLQRRYRASAELGVFRVETDCGYISFRLQVEPGDVRYDYSKLYYSVARGQPYDESRVICFRVRGRGIFEEVCLVLPEAARRSGYLRLRLDGLGEKRGTFAVRDVRFVGAHVEDEQTRRARLIEQKQRVREEVLRSEDEKRAALPHYPESLSLELTPRCNLTCTHCSSHGTDALHRLNNRRAPFTAAALERLGHEVFPHLTSLTLVGRGEPLMVSEALWTQLITLLERYGVFLNCVTNGYFIKRRITKKVLPLIDILTVSIDGMDAQTFAENRGGADLERVLDNVRYFHELRTRTALARRPRLGFSWTLKRNNIAQFPDFIRFIKQFEPESLYVRHLLLFHEKDREQSLVNDPALANRYLREAYALLAGMNIKHDCPPLTAPDSAQNGSRAAREQRHLPVVQDAAGESKCQYFHRTGVIMADGELVTCANMYAGSAGHLSERMTFLDLWNGEAMRSVRASFGTDKEWEQCRACWYREIKYHSQRRAWMAGESYALTAGTQFSAQAWDFRGYEPNR